MEKNSELVSIGMPVYNDKLFLTRAIDSLLNQTYKNFELIISDDCSSDGSSEICLEAVKNDNRIRYIRQPRNIGISRNMEFLLKQAKGEYFMWAANDDLWHPEFIMELVKGLKDNPDSVSAFCGVLEIDENDSLLRVIESKSIDYRGDTPEIRLKKFIKIFYDGFGYGLFVKNKIVNVRFPVWWWINKDCPYNNIYPTLCFYLTKGNYISCGEVPLWFNRMKNENNINHKIPYPNSFLRGYFAFFLRKINLVVISMIEISRAGGGFLLCFKVSISMIYHWFFKLLIYEFISKSKSLYHKRIKFW